MAQKRDPDWSPFHSPMHGALARYWPMWAITAVMLHVVLLTLYFLPSVSHRPPHERTVRVTLFRQAAAPGEPADAAGPATPPRADAEPPAPPIDLARTVDAALQQADAILSADALPVPRPDARIAGSDVLERVLSSPRLLPSPRAVQEPGGGAAGPVGPPRPAAGPRLPGSFQARTDAGRGQALAKFGGTPQTEAGVDLALDWLAAHQEPAGQWDRVNFVRFDPPTAPSGGAPTMGLKYDLDVGLTGLATLAFLGRGYDHERDSKYRMNVKRAVGYLLRSQRPGGQFGPRSNLMMYNQAIASLAVAEALILTGDPQLRRPLRDGVAYLLAAQQAEGGWDYQPARTGRNDTSITGWVVMALRSAQSAGVPIPSASVLGAMRHFQQATEEEGAVWYADKGIGVRDDEADDAGGGQKKRYGPAMLAVGLYSRLLLGWDPLSRVCRQAADLILDDLPDQRKMRTDPTNLHSYYYWYYGSLAMFHMGDGYWKRWNLEIQRQVLSGQQPLANARRGSWQPYGDGWGLWGKYGGRVYSTAVNALTLEIYYRYLPLYTTHDVLSATDALIRALVGADTVAAKQAVLAHAADLLPAVAEPVLRAALKDPDLTVRLDAAIALAEDRDPVALPVLTDLYRRVDFKQGAVIAKALGELHDPAAIGLLIEMLDGHWVVAKAADAALRQLTDANVVRSGGVGRGLGRETIDAWKQWWAARSAEARIPL